MTFYASHPRLHKSAPVNSAIPSSAAQSIDIPLLHCTKHSPPYHSCSGPGKFFVIKKIHPPLSPTPQFAASPPALTLDPSQLRTSRSWPVARGANNQQESPDYTELEKHFFFCNFSLERERKTLFDPTFVYLHENPNGLLYIEYPKLSWPMEYASSESNLIRLKN